MNEEYAERIKQIKSIKNLHEKVEHIREAIDELHETEELLSMLMEAEGELDEYRLEQEGDEILERRLRTEGVDTAEEYRDFYLSNM